MDKTKHTPDKLYTIFPNEYYMDIMLFQHGFERCQPLHSYGPAVRSHYLFHFVYEGSGTLIATSLDGVEHTYPVKKNQGFLVCPKQITTYIADEDTPWEYAWVEFDGAKAAEWLNQAGLSADHPVFECSNEEALSLIQSELLSLISGTGFKKPVDTDHFETHYANVDASVLSSNSTSMFQVGHFYLFMDQLIHSSIRYNSTSHTNQRDFYIRQAVSYIEQNFSEPITIEDIADFCCLNRSYLGKIFKDSLNKTPQQYLIYYRMKQATQMLKYTSMSVGEIGKAVGYPNQLHFSRAFRNVYQMPPSEWRKANGIV
ncbi:MAG: AraC family transcriptional regulator [Lachnospiraceae bacterium]|nr:AraC family transcriptional regulator [Lachnospiraceae bacterium]